MCGGGGEPKQDFTVQNKQADLAQQLDADWRNRFLPIERQMVAKAQDKTWIGQSARTAANVAGHTYDAGADNNRRQLAGFGMRLNADQQKAYGAQQKRDRNAAVMGASDAGRQQAANRYGQMQGSLMNVGRQVQGQGTNGLNQAGTLENQRNITNQQTAAQNSAGAWDLAGKAVGMGASVMMMASDKKKKKNITPRSDEQDMNDARSFGNYEYDYKPGMSGGRSEQGHVGGMAQEIPPSMSDGQQVDLGDATMVAFGAIRNMDKRLKQLEANGFGRQQA